MERTSAYTTAKLNYPKIQRVPTCKWNGFQICDNPTELCTSLVLWVVAHSAEALLDVVETGCSALQLQSWDFKYHCENVTNDTCDQWWMCSPTARCYHALSLLYWAMMANCGFSGRWWPCLVLQRIRLHSSTLHLSACCCSSREKKHSLSSLPYRSAVDQYRKYYSCFILHSMSRQ